MDNSIYFECKNFGELHIGGFHLYLFPFDFPFNHILNYIASSGISSQSVQTILIWRVTYNETPILVLSLLKFSEMTSELITFHHLRCHSSSTALRTRTGYWKPTQRGTDETPHVFLICIHFVCTHLQFSLV